MEPQLAHKRFTEEHRFHKLAMLI